MRTALVRLHTRTGTWRWWQRGLLDSAQGKAGYAQPSRTIEPVFGQVKTVQGRARFMRRGLRACQAEWKLLCSTHNPLKRWRRTTAAPADQEDPAGASAALQCVSC
jgi:hypothetical protein